MVTIGDIAKRAGVSAATVSYILNNKKSISEDTKKRVFDVIKELNYKPSKIARSLATQNTQIIGVLISDIANPFFSSIVRGIQDIVEANGYTAIIGNSDENEAKAKHYMDVMQQHRVDGLIMSPILKKSKIYESWDYSVPLVFVNRRSEKVAADIVETDNESGSYQAVCHLASMGHKKIAFICGPTNVSTYADRLKGFKKGIKDNKLVADADLIKVGGYSYESGYQIVNEIYTSENRPSAIIVASGWLSRGVFWGIKELKVRIPDEISLVTFDEVEWSSLVTPSLTTVAQRTFEMGQIAADILLKRLSGSDEKPQLEELDHIQISDTNHSHIRLMPKLIIRESVGMYQK